MISVITNTIGQRTTPAVRLNERFSIPRIVRFNGSIPKVDSNEKIFTPINSARIAFATKNDPRM
jgi:hypothetical protein